MVPFKRNIFAIWLCGGPKFLYLNWETAKTIHSFYDVKKKVIVRTNQFQKDGSTSGYKYGTPMDRHAVESKSTGDRTV